MSNESYATQLTKFYKLAFFFVTALSSGKPAK